jgi:hypothetical protein
VIDVSAIFVAITIFVTPSGGFLQLTKLNIYNGILRTVRIRIMYVLNQFW